MMKINSCDIKSFKNIMSMFNGSSQFLIENPWFEYKSYSKIKITNDNFMSIVMNGYMKTPKVLLKNIRTNTYSALYYIKWTNKDNINQYWLSIPKSDKNEINEKVVNQKLWLTPYNFDVENIRREDHMLLILDRQLSIGLDIILSCVILNINPSNFNSDYDLLNEILEKLECENKEECIKNYISYFNDCFTVNSNEYYIMNIIHDQIKSNSFNIEHQSKLLDAIKGCKIENNPRILQAICVNGKEKLLFNSTVNFRTKGKSKYDITKICEINGKEGSYRDLTVKDLKSLFNGKSNAKVDGFVNIKPSFPLAFPSNDKLFKYYPLCWDVDSFYLSKPKSNILMDDLKAILKNN